MDTNKRRIVQVVHDQDEDTITFEAPREDGTGDTILAMPAPKERVEDLEQMLGDLAVAVLMGGGL